MKDLNRESGMVREERHDVRAWIFQHFIANFVHFWLKHIQYFNILIKKSSHKICVAQS